MSSLSGRKVILGVCGSIAAYKSPLIVRELTARGADVYVVVTPSALNFVSRLVLENLSRNKVIVDMFDPEIQEGGSWHIHLARSADAMLIAPCTAKSLASLSHGYADTAVACLAISLPEHTPLVVAPAMDHEMWEHRATQHNCTTLRSRGTFVIEPEFGELASGLTGKGRLPEAATLVSNLEKLLPTSEVKVHPPSDSGSTAPFNIETEIEKRIKEAAEQSSNPLQDAIAKDSFTAELYWQQLKNSQQTGIQGKKVLITAGPTQEPIDAVRYISNASSGKMGYALAIEAAKRGASVQLVSGPVSIPRPDQIHIIDVRTAEEMYGKVMERVADFDIAILCAAVADFSPDSVSAKKIKKAEVGSTMDLKLVKTKDILAELGALKKSSQYLVGFALETDDEMEAARDKLIRKNCNMIVLNTAAKPQSGFGGDYNTISILSRTTEGIGIRELPAMTKSECAAVILNDIEKHTAVDASASTNSNTCSTSS